MKNRICFMANFSKTFLWHAISEMLSKYNVEVCWITCNKKLYSFLLEHYPKEHILLISWDNMQFSAPVVGEYKLNELIIGDRTLRLTPSNALKYLMNIQMPIYNFLRDLNIKTVFGEITWAHELLIHRIVSNQHELKCRYLCPHTVRIPNGRFAFFKDEFQSDILDFEFNNALNYELNLGGWQVADQLEKPEYLFLNDAIMQKSRSLKGRLAMIKRYLTRENIENDDPTIISSAWKRFKLRAGVELNKEFYRFVPRIKLGALSQQPYIFFALHKQPEASIDVIGRYYEDQFLNILNLWRVLPNGWKLIIKEHSNAIGDRNYSFYSNLLKYPNLFFLHESTDSHEVIRHAELIVTVSGTVAYEAALMNKHSLTFAPTFFNRLPKCRKITLEDLKVVGDIRELLVSKPNSINEFKAWLMKNSFEGIISDPISDPRCMTYENITKLKGPFHQVININGL